MKIVAISDTHSKHRTLIIPDADTIVCAGDISFKGEFNIVEDFINWMKALPIKNKVMIFGNHELGMASGPKRDTALKLLQDSGIIYLEDSGTEIDGIKFWGSPVQPRFYDWEWNKNRGPDIDKHWKLIPLDTNVLITHGPPHGILDLVTNSIGRDPHQGCEDLKRKVDKLNQLKLHVFGHLHHEGGNKLVVDNKIFINAAICDDLYNPSRPPILVEI